MNGHFDLGEPPPETGFAAGLGAVGIDQAVGLVLAGLAFVLGDVDVRSVARDHPRASHPGIRQLARPHMPIDVGDVLSALLGLGLERDNLCSGLLRDGSLGVIIASIYCR